jgi:hypothetical protein
MEAAQIAEHHRITPATRTCGDHGGQLRGDKREGKEDGEDVQEVRNFTRKPMEGSPRSGKQQSSPRCPRRRRKTTTMASI